MSPSPTEASGKMDYAGSHPSIRSSANTNVWLFRLPVALNKAGLWGLGWERSRSSFCLLLLKW